MTKPISPELQEILINVITFIAGFLTRLIQKSKTKDK